MRSSVASRSLAAPSRIGKSALKSQNSSGSNVSKIDHPSEGGSNIRVVVRCRGRNDREVKAKSRVVVDTSISKTEIAVKIGQDPASTNTKTYSIDHVFGPEADQVMVFDEVVAPIVDDLFTGMNCTVFAYGQTGTGKTYTMSGDDSANYDTCAYEAGIIPRVLFKLFNDIQSKGYDHSVSCSFVELYNEELKDLLLDDDDIGKKLRLFDDSSSLNKRPGSITPNISNGVTLNGLSENHISSAISGLKVLQDGLRKRQVASTKMNDYSSRSHTIFCINVALDTDGSGEFITKGKINLVDLAGSENIGKSGAENKRAREAGMINQSLLTLGRVINSLVDKTPHIPYRESKLTRLLQDSLGGRTKTCIIATISPALVNIEETLSTLEYASRAKNIKNKPQVNNAISKKVLLTDYNNEMEKLRLDLIATRKKNGIYLDPENYTEMNADRESQKMLLNDQQRKLETVDKQLKTAREQLDITKHELQNKTRQLQSTATELNQTMDSLSSVEQSLRQTRQDLDRETLLRKAHASTEDELQSIGGTLIKNLDQTLEDVNILQDKLSKIRENQSSIDRLVSDSTLRIAQQVNNLSSKFEEYDGKQRQIADSFYQTVISLVNEECNRLTDTSSFLTDSLANIDILRGGLLQSTSKTESYSKQLSEHATKLKGNIISGIQEGLLEQMKTSMVKFTNLLSTELEGFKIGIQQPLNEMMTELNSSAQLRTNYFTMQSDKLLTLKNGMALTLSGDSLTTSYNDGIKKLEKVLEEEKKRSSEEKNQLMANISMLFDKYTSDTNNRMIDAVHSTTTDIMSNSVQHLRQHSDEWNKNIDEIENNNTQYQDIVSGEDIRLAKNFKTVIRTLNSGSDRMEFLTGQLQTESESAIHSGLASVSSQVKALDKFLIESGGTSENHVQAVNQGVADLCANVQHAFAYLENHLGNLKANIQSHVNSQDTEELASQLIKQWNSIKDQSKIGLMDILQQIEHLKEGINNNRGLPTGNTPKRRKIEYARVLPNTNHQNPTDSIGADESSILYDDATRIDTDYSRQPLEDVTNENVLPSLPSLFDTSITQTKQIKPTTVRPINSRLRSTTGRTLRRN